MSEIYIVVNTADVNNILIISALKERYGKDIILVTPDQIKKRGLDLSCVANIPTMKITAPILQSLEGAEYKTGKEMRRERRRNERMKRQISR